MTTDIDYGYAANLEELQSLIENLTSAAEAEYGVLNKDRHFDPSVVGFDGLQIKAVLQAKALEDGSYVFDIKLHFDTI